MDHPPSVRAFAGIVGEILKGRKPSDIPVFQPTKFDIAINLKTKHSASVPPDLLTTADAVID